MSDDTPDSAIPIILLAAGAGRRMGGRDKLLELVDKTPLLRMQAKAAIAATAGLVIVTLPPRPHARYDALQNLDLTQVPVPDRHLGLSASLRAGLLHVPATARAAMVLLSDLPDLTTTDLKKVLQNVDHERKNLIWRGATEAGKPGHPVVFARRLFPALMALGGDSGGAEVIKAHDDRTVLIRLPGGRALRDLDTPADWDEWRKDRDNP
ncbi:MAG: nucleotidyltransferase family protein [Pseudomonadota bacterium]